MLSQIFFSDFPRFFVSFQSIFRGLIMIFRIYPKFENKIGLYLG
jgi:hypothetical protein